MANWAYTRYVIEGTPHAIKLIYDAIINPDTSEGDSDWEGGVLKALGLKYEVTKSNNLRGFIRYVQEPEDNVLRFNAQEAWHLTDFSEILRGAFSDSINIYYMLEEPGLGIYCTNDSDGKYFPERYYVSIYTDDKCYDDYFCSEEDMYKRLSTVTNGTVTNEQELMKHNDSYVIGEDVKLIPNAIINVQEFEVLLD